MSGGAPKGSQTLELPVCIKYRIDPAAVVRQVETLSIEKHATYKDLHLIEENGGRTDNLRPRPTWTSLPTNKFKTVFVFSGTPHKRSGFSITSFFSFFQLLQYLFIDFL